MNKIINFLKRWINSRAISITDLKIIKTVLEWHNIKFITSINKDTGKTIILCQSDVGIPQFILNQYGKRGTKHLYNGVNTTDDYDMFSTYDLVTNIDFIYDKWMDLKNGRRVAVTSLTYTNTNVVIIYKILCGLGISCRCCGNFIVTNTVTDNYPNAIKKHITTLDTFSRVTVIRMMDTLIVQCPCEQLDFVDNCLCFISNTGRDQYIYDIFKSRLKVLLEKWG
jgi:hypothetical protein